MAIYELTLHGLLFNQNMVNRFNYQTPGIGDTPGGAGGLMDSFVTTVLPAVRGVLSLNVTFNRVYVVSVYDPDDFAEIIFTPGQAGGRATEAMPPFVAADFRTNRATRDIRRGNKRFGGVGEGDVSGNTWNITVALREALENALVDVLDWAPAPTNYFTPVIIQKQAVIAAPPIPVVYQYYPTESEQRQHLFVPTEWDFYRLTTQRSRQLGHGT